MATTDERQIVGQAEPEMVGAGDDDIGVSTMAGNDSLLSFIARRHTLGYEDVATDALFFILSRSTSAMETLSHFLGDEQHGALPIAKAKPWAADAHGAIPDLACFGDDDNLLALIESKFWAQLTHHQPVTYWEALPDDKPSVLLFLAPKFRVEQGSLWRELVGRLRRAGHELGDERRGAGLDESLIVAPAQSGQRRLILTSWQLLLDRMAEGIKKAGDTQACFEIAELQGLAARAIARDNPQRENNLERLITQAVNRVKQSGWANTKGLTVGKGFNFWGRYLRLAGSVCWLGIRFTTVKRLPDKPLWLSFSNRVAQDVRTTLAALDEPDIERSNGRVRIPIVLPAAAGHEATLNAIVTQLERIAKLIDPDGPTYRKAD